ncbi:hypothetical protein OH77DRAFT_783109 [Trametes cingulata]|nr:hypothetical protein OH77DRAFT_783109 [Trametes cingulata]
MSSSSSSEASSTNSSWSPLNTTPSYSRAAFTPNPEPGSSPSHRLIIPHHMLPTPAKVSAARTSTAPSASWAARTRLPPIPIASNGSGLPTRIPEPPVTAVGPGRAQHSQEAFPALATKKPRTQQRALRGKWRDGSDACRL